MLVVILYFCIYLSAHSARVFLAIKHHAVTVCMLLLILEFTYTTKPSDLKLDLSPPWVQSYEFAVHL